MTMHAASPLSSSNRQLLFVLAIPIVGGFILGWTGSGALGALPRPLAAPAGVLVALLGWLGAEAGTRIAAAAAHQLRPSGVPLVAVLAAGILFSGPIAVPATYAVQELFGLDGLERLRGYSPARAAESLIAPLVLWISVNLALVRLGVPRFGYARPAPRAPAPRAEDGGAAALLALVRPAVRGPILALEAEQHYVRVHTARGQDLIHHRFGDAVRLLANVPGAQVHRSWWVSADSVDPERSAGARLRLRSGLDVPVGRTFLLQARALGLTGGDATTAR